MLTQFYDPSLRSRLSSLRLQYLRAAFTLVELLVVMAIIAILAGLGLAAAQGALNSGKKAQARNDAQQIVAAVKAYQLEYGRLPTANTGGNESSEGWFGSEDNAQIIKVLTGRNENGLNPREISFLNAKTTTTKKGGIDPESGVFYDPWGNAYSLKLDTDYNGKIEYYGPGSEENIFSSAMVVSGGPDGDLGNPFESGSDDIGSFK